MDYKEKYIKYKLKYLELENNYEIQIGGRNKFKNKFKNNSFNKDKMDNNITVNYTESLSEPWFSLISLGLKTVEGRKNKGRFREMKVGDIVKWTNNDFMPRSVLTKITEKTEYNKFKEYLETEGLDKCLPGMPDLEHGLSVYFKYYTKKDEEEFGVIAIKFELLK